MVTGEYQTQGILETKKFMSGFHAHAQNGRKKMTTSIEDHAAMRLKGESVECLCDEYAHLLLHQAAEIKVLKEKLRHYLEAYLKILNEEICQDQSKP